VIRPCCAGGGKNNAPDAFPVVVVDHFLIYSKNCKSRGILPDAVAINLKSANLKLAANWVIHLDI
jgi:hypothetical protein